LEWHVIIRQLNRASVGAVLAGPLLRRAKTGEVM
jgi:hypothetical protein